MSKPKIRFELYNPSDFPEQFYLSMHIGKKLIQKKYFRGRFQWSIQRKIRRYKRQMTKMYFMIKETINEADKEDESADVQEYWRG